MLAFSLWSMLQCQTQRLAYWKVHSRPNYCLLILPLQDNFLFVLRLFILVYLGKYSSDTFKLEFELTYISSVVSGNCFADKLFDTDGLIVVGRGWAETGAGPKVTPNSYRSPCPELSDFFNDKLAKFHRNMEDGQLLLVALWPCHCPPPPFNSQPLVDTPTLELPCACCPGAE